MQVLDGPKETIYSLAYSPDGERLACAVKDGSVWEWRHTSPISWKYNDAAFSVCYSPDGLWIMFGHSTGWSGFRTVEDAKLRLWEVGSTDRASVVGVSCLDDKTVFVGTGERVKPSPGYAELWTLTDQRRREPRFQEPAGVRAVATHPPSRRVAWANGSRRVTVWDVTKPDPLHFNQPYNSTSLGFHPDGHLLATATEWDVRIYDIIKRWEINSLKGHTGRVTSVAFSPDGRTLATGSWDETVRLWDAATGAETACFRWPVGKVFCLAYAPDGLRLAAGGDKGTIVVWDVG